MTTIEENSIYILVAIDLGISVKFIDEANTALYTNVLQMDFEQFEKEAIRVTDIIREKGLLQNANERAEYYEEILKNKPSIIPPPTNRSTKPIKAIVIKDKKVCNDKYSDDNADRFYSSLEWKKLRVDIIEKYSGKCQMCGRSYKEHGVIMHIDHIIPLSVDWSRRLDESNLQLLCEDCNMGKGNRYTTDWRKT